MKRSDRLDLMIEGPRVQLPVECVHRNRHRPPPPPPPAAALTTELTDPDDFAESALGGETFGCQVHEVATRPAGPPAPPWVEEAVEWVCPPQWLTPPMRAEGSIVWLDPEPLRVSGPVTIWLSARFENGGSKVR